MSSFRILAHLLLLYLRSRRRTRHSFKKSSLSHWSKSSVYVTLEGKDNRSYFHFVGLDVSSFDHLFDLISPAFRSHRSVGRPYCIPPRYQLALVLHFLKSCCGYKEISMLFCIGESSICTIIHKFIPILLHVLENDPDGRIQWPQEDEIRYFQSLISKRHPQLEEGVFGFLDGLQLTCSNHANPYIQNAFYNGHKHDTFVSNIIVWAPDGTACFAVLNFPGSYHDARIAEPVYEVLNEHTPEDCYLLGDSAFQFETPKIITPFEKNQFHRDPAIREEQKRLHSERVSARQAVEWGMGHLQRSFPRLQVELRGSDWEYNEQLICLCLHLSNFQVRRMKLFNQINTVFQ